MLPQTFWRQIEGTVIDGKVRVGNLLRAEREGLFAAEPVQEGIFDRAAALAVRFLRATSEPTLERYLEASFLVHPHLLRCYTAGTFDFAGTQFVYAVLDPSEATLADASSERPLSPEETKELGLQLISALGYLHGRDLVYCNLDPTTVVRSGDAWKLSEYSQLRVAGRGYSGETRRMLALSAGTPPEAWDGIVSPAWDAWGLAWLLAGAISERRMPTRETAASRTPSRRPLPEPFAGIVTECLNANPAERCGLSRIGELLQGAPAHVPATPAIEAAEPEEPIPSTVPPAARDPREHRPWLRALTPKQALGTAIAFVAGFVLVATLAYHPNRSSSAATIAHPAPAVLPTTPVSEPMRRPNGEADRAMLTSDSPSGLLQRWADSIRTRNLDEQLACYAPMVFAFYGDRNVTPEDIRERRASAMVRFDDVRRLDISNVNVVMKSPNAAVATFDEQWDFRGQQPSSGKVKERLGLHKVGGHWRITSESNVQTFYKNGPNPQS